MQSNADDTCAAQVGQSRQESGTRTVMLPSEFFRSVSAKEFISKLFHQVEKISRLILGEIREIRKIVESEDSQVHPLEATGEEETKKANKGGVPTLISKEQAKVVEVEDPGAFCWCC